MRALITGSEGFIGKNILEEALARGYEVKGLELKEFYDQNWFRNLRNIVSDYFPDVIFHVGACSDTLEKDVNYMMELNYESTKILTDWCKENGKKIVYSSSAANYGQAFFPSNLYGWSKYVAEGYVVANGGVGLRYFNVYGPGEEHKGKMSSVAYQSYIKNKKGEEIILFPKKPKRDFVYVKDVVSANFHAEECYISLGGDWYDIGSFSSRLFEDVLSGIGIQKWSYSSEEDIPIGYQFNTHATKLMPSWVPKFNLEEGLKDYIIYLQNG